MGELITRPDGRRHRVRTDHACRALLNEMIRLEGGPLLRFLRSPTGSGGDFYGYRLPRSGKIVPRITVRQLESRGLISRVRRSSDEPVYLATAESCRN